MTTEMSFGYISSLTFNMSLYTKCILRTFRVFLNVGVPRSTPNLLLCGEPTTIMFNLHER